MMFPTLFDKRVQEPKNIISHGGEAIYYGEVFEEGHADEVFKKLLHQTKWKKSTWVIYDKEHITERKVAWYSKRKVWPVELLEMKKVVEGITGITYNSVLLNLYETGNVGMGWHRDDESLEEDSSIVSVSLGAERRFDFRHVETKETVSIILEHGSMLVMQGVLQNFWKHQVPKSKRVHHPRINLTFRR